MSAAHELLQLRVLPQPKSLVYGPIFSRRLGHSLGINLLGAVKVCSFDCPYCELGRTEMRLNQIKKDHQLPTPEQLQNEMREMLRQLIKKNTPIDHFTISGNGEPTLSPYFAEMVEVVLSVRTEFQLQTPTVLMTNGMHFDSRKVVQAANALDERMVKIDAGSDERMKVINAPLVRASVSRVTTGARQLKDCVVQSLFIQGSIDNTTTEALEEWMELIGIVKPKLVHITGLDRVPPQSGLLRVAEDDLYAIASKLKRRTSIESVVFP